MSEEMERIKDVPWVKAMLETLQDEVKKTVISFSLIAVELSTDKNDIESWAKIFQEQFRENCEDLLNDMKHLKMETISKVESSLNKIQELCKILQIGMPDLAHEKCSLYQEHHKLKKYILEYEQLIQSRKQEWNNLLVKQEILCNSLGRRPKFLRDDPLPTQSDLQQGQEYIEDLENENFQRQEKYTMLKDEILNLVATLHYEPNNEFEKFICDENDKEFCVSDENMKQLERFRDKLVLDKQKIAKDIDNLWTSIDHHWNLLDVDIVRRESFRKKNPGISYDVLNVLKKELKHCEEQKRASLKIFIDRLRNELNELWVKCHCTNKEKLDFGFFDTVCYTEDLLDLHEAEIKKWRKYYEENKELLLLLEKYHKLWSKMIKIEENACGPNRYKNRGGQLLQEEKERNKLAKKIPTLEVELKFLAENYESRQGSPFLTHGQTVETYIGDLHADQENSKKQKLSARKQQRDITTPTSTGKSTVSILPHTGSTQQIPSSSKRKLLLTPLIDDRKKAKVTPRIVITEAKSQKIKPRIVATRVSTERKKRVEKIKRRSLLKKEQLHAKNDTMSRKCSGFEDFKDYLSAREGCRSTTFLYEELPPTRNLATITATPSETALCPTPSRADTPKSERRTPRTPLTANGANKQLSTANSALKLIF